MNALVTVPATNAELYRASTDAAGLCREIVLKTAQNIQGRKYVKVEGWQAIAVAHGCVASAEEVQRVEDDGAGGYRAWGVIRRMSDGAEIARAEGFVGDDEQMWAKRPVYARRAMAQTRAISRACRSAFAHVVVLIDANLSTTPAEEVPDDGFEERRQSAPQPKAAPVDWQTLDNEMDACRSIEELEAWNIRRTAEIKALPKAKHDSMADKFMRLRGTLPDQAPAAELRPENVPEFA